MGAVFAMSVQYQPVEQHCSYFLPGVTTSMLHLQVCASDMWCVPHGNVLLRCPWDLTEAPGSDLHVSY